MHWWVWWCQGRQWGGGPAPVLEGHKGIGSGKLWHQGSALEDCRGPQWGTTMGIWGCSRGKICWGPPALNISLMKELLAKRISARLCWSGEWGDTGRMPPTLSYAAIHSPCASLVVASCQLHSKLSQSYFHLWIVVKSLVLLKTGRDKGWDLLFHHLANITLS